MSLTQISSSKCFGGNQSIYSHYSNELTCDMKFSIYLPADTDETNKVPVLYWLSGLTCTEENFIQKSGAQRYAAQHGICIVCPDTSPRNVNLAGEDDSYDFGSGAGFYVDATEKPWSKHYRMFTYVTSELIDLIVDNFPVVADKQSIAGHSMGGHGALICALKNPGLYASVSALAPISNPIKCAWGRKALKGYMGDDETVWKEWDATELAASYDGIHIELFIDQVMNLVPTYYMMVCINALICFSVFKGSEDNFYKQGQLLPENLVKEASQNSKVQSVLKLRDGYDHSYYYVASFIGEHIEYHAKFLK